MDDVVCYRTFDYRMLMIFPCSIIDSLAFDQLSLDFKKEARRIGLKVNTKLTNILSLMGHRIFPFCINRQNVERVEPFVYLCITLYLSTLSPNLMSPDALPALNTPSPEILKCCVCQCSH